jgi:hypothetical protein
MKDSNIVRWKALPGSIHGGERGTLSALLMSACSIQIQPSHACSDQELGQSVWKWYQEMASKVVIQPKSVQICTFWCHMNLSKRSASLTLSRDFGTDCYKLRTVGSPSEFKKYATPAVILTFAPERDLFLPSLFHVADFDCYDESRDPWSSERSPRSWLHPGTNNTNVME